MEPLPDPNTRYSDLDGLARLLREHPESARVEWLEKAVPGSPFGGFFLARRVRLSRSASRRLMESTVERSNVSTVQWWLELYGHACGLRRAVMMLDEWRLTRPEMPRRPGSASSPASIHRKARRCTRSSSHVGRSP